MSAAAPRKGRLALERLGGLGGFGLAGSAIRSHAELALADLTGEEQAAVDALLAGAVPAAPPGAADGFRYRLTVTPADGSPVRSVEVPEHAVPARLRNQVRDELR